MTHFDAIVVGGGISGSTTAAALAQRGRKVLLCESGLPNSRRLAGELMHPPAAERLKDLGLLSALEDAGGVPVYGFVIFRDAEDPGTLLSYSEIPGCRPTGFALQHSTICKTLLDAVSERENVTVWNGARVQSVDQDGARPKVHITRDGEQLVVEADVVVSADGRASKLRKNAGITTKKTDAMRMLGWRVEGGRLPYPGYGHIFIGGHTPTLAYQVGRDDVRVMFELGLDEGLDVPDNLLNAIPSPLREDIMGAIANGQRQTSRIFSSLPNRFSAGSLVVVGDAGGCVHPVSASGIAFCTSDAVGLASCLGEARGPEAIRAALRRYDQQRKGPMRTRSSLGPALLHAFSGQGPDMRLLRHGLFRYWERNARGRRVSMGLLATHEQGMLKMAREYVQVCAHSLHGVTQGVVTPGEIPQALLGLVGRTSEILRQSLS